MPRPIWLVLLVALGCRPPAEADVVPDETTAPQRSALELSDELEALIEQGTGTEDDRVRALEQVRALSDDGSAGYAFARAAVAGRVAELRGVKAGKLVGEAEGFALESIERDPEFRARAASRMLGSLWVMAPPRLLEHGDSEEGLSMLETLAKEQPQELLNHLRLAEAYVFLGDPEPAVPHLCIVQQGRASLRRDDAALLQRLMDEVSEEEPVECEATTP
ncbi:hypothetical protein [Paraliomyxa miuraensis]|uniref:hypothetical protein n=1 Tax=Paraliomyxa miuraensis TaxID=376150 RepID=UPI0022508C98|nr:hypothetical protein [Paraliomyxa miuraensis]MCX4245826.1 hypothetical protein [Paraliomyxa miuraensis]